MEYIQSCWEEIYIYIYIWTYSYRDWDMKSHVTMTRWQRMVETLTKPRLLHSLLRWLLPASHLASQSLSSLICKWEAAPNIISVWIKYKTAPCIWFHLYETSRTGRTTQIASRSVIAWRWGLRIGITCKWGLRDFIWNNGNILKLDYSHSCMTQ